MQYLMYLALPYLKIFTLLFCIAYLTYSIFSTYKQRKQHDKVIAELSQNLVANIADYLLSKADDERPIMLNVNTDRLVEKVADEVEKRQSERNMLRRV